MALDGFIGYLQELGENIQNGNVDLDEPENLVISLDGGYTIYDEDRNVLLDLAADSDNNTLLAQGDNGTYEHTFFMGGQDDWNDEEVELWDALQNVRASLY